VPCVGDMASDGCQPLVFNGQLTGYNKDNQNGKISFPAAATSYRQLRVGTGRSSTLQATVVPDSDVEFRTRALYGRNNKAHEKTQFNSEGIPIGVANVTGSQYAKPSGSVRRPAAMMQPASIPLTLCASWPLRGSDKHIPSVGWRCSAEDAGCAVEAKCAMLDAHGDELSESSLGAALSAAEGARSASFVVSSIRPLDGVTDVGAAVAQCVDVSVVLLTCCFCRLGMRCTGAPLHQLSSKQPQAWPSVCVVRAPQARWSSSTRSWRPPAPAHRPSSST
jgi:hypothetical protein